MSFSASDLGELGHLATALGILDAGGDFNDDWLSAPGDYLSRVLANQTQRDALVAFVDEVLGGEERQTDADGLVWLPIVSHDNPRITFYLVLDASPANSVSIGVGVLLTTSATASLTTLHVPLFRAAKEGRSVPDAILIGTAGAVLRLTTEITLGTAPPLRGIGLSLRVPTGGGQAPELGLTLTGLQLPGASAPRDITISVSDLDELDDVALDLILGLVRSQAGALGAGPLASVIGLLGLDGGGAVPTLPLSQLKSQGARALGTWFESVVSSASARSAWLGHLSALLGGAVSGDDVVLTIGAAQVALGVRVESGTGGHPVVTPTLGVFVSANANARIRADVELLRLDLATGTATALPRLAAFAQLGRRPDGGADVLAGDPRVEAVRAGIALDDARRPTFLLAADRVTIGAHFYDTLDLTTPDAIAEVGAGLLSDVVDDLIGQLGPIGNAVRLLTGLQAPAGDPGIPLVELPAFLADPLGAVRGYWRTVLRDHAAAVPEILTTLRDLLADASRAATAVTGAGSEADPWHVPLVGPITLDAWRTNGGDVLELALGAGYVADNLGNRCTRVETALVAGLARLDLAGVQATLLSSVEVRIIARARGGTQAFVDIGPIQLSADHIGLRARWRPAGGLSVDVLAPNLSAEIDEVSVPLALPVLGEDGALTLDAAGWDGLERLAGLLASVAALPWVRELAVALGWLGQGARPRLRLANLASGDAAAAVKGWLTGLALDDGGRIGEGLAALARLLTGTRVSTGRLRGTGTIDDPYRAPLLPVASSPELAAWLLPRGPARETATNITDPLRHWRPLSPGLTPLTLSDALAAEAFVADDVADLMKGRESLADGLGLLLDRWTGTDGLIVPPPADPAGVTVHRLPNVSADQLTAAVNIAALLGAAPATTFDVAIVADGEALPWPAAPADRIIDLRAPGLAPETFVPPAAAAGEWFVALAPRSDARLASDDPDGTAGQSERLRRVLAPFGAVAGQKVVVARGGAGHAALDAANALAFVDAVVTLGTPFTPVAFTIIDDAAAGDALRLLRWLLPAVDPGEPDDPDLALGRSIVGAMMRLTTLDDPGADLRPSAEPSTPRAGLAVHACFGTIELDAVLRAITAIVAAGLSGRAMARAASGRPRVTGARGGLRVPLSVSSSDLAISGYALLEVVGVDAGDPSPTLSTNRALDVHLEIRRPNGWLSGGPNGVDPPPTAELRWFSANMHLPFGAAGGAEAELILHEPSIFGLARERWIVRPSGTPSTAAEIVTPALPEARVLLSLVAERLTSAAAASPAIGAVFDALRGLGLLSPAGGSNPDGIDHFLYDTAAHVTDALDDAARRAQIGAGVTQLLDSVPGVTVDLANRRVTLDASGTPRERGMVAWTAHLEATAAGQVTGLATLGTAGTGAAGGAVLRIDASAPGSTPVTVALDWHRAGDAPETIALWPAPDTAAIGRMLARLVPAECARAAIEFLRKLDATAKVVLDAGLDAIGLLAAADARGNRGVVLPIGLLANPAGWFQHPSSLGGPDGFSPARVITLLDSLKPIVGIAGNPGEWNLGTGVKVVAQSQAGQLRLGLAVDTSALAPIGGAPGRLVAGGMFALTFPASGVPQPSVDVSVGLEGAAPGRRAVHVASNGGLRVFLRPDTGPDLPLYPNPPGLAQLAQAAVTQALPLILDALAAESGADFAGQVGAVVRAVGDGLDLRTGMPLKFDGARLQAWATNPAAAFAAAIPTLTHAAMEAVATAVQPVLPAGATAAAAAGKLTVTVNSLSFTWQPAPFEITLGGTVTGISGIDRVAPAITLDATGLKQVSVKVGPASIDAGGVTLRPYVSADVGQAPVGGRRVEVGLSRDLAGMNGFGARWNLDTATLSLVAADGGIVSTDPAEVALALLDAVLDLVATFAIQTSAVQELLGHSVGATNVRNTLRGVVLADVVNPVALDADLFDAPHLLHRLQKLAANLAAANPAIAIGGGLSIGLTGAGSIVKLTLGVNGRIPLSQSGVVVSIEADSRWIKDQPPAGLSLSVLSFIGDSFTFAPGFEVDGIGLRFSKSGGPLLDLGVTLGSIALHVFGKLQGGTLSGGVQVQLSDLAVGVGGAQGGNPIAQGIMKDSGSGSSKLAPAFSPALAVQKHGNDPVLVSLSAGDGSGPWWLAIQRGFGPLYVEQVGFGVTVVQDQLQRISILLDGRVSIFGLTAAVDDLQLTFVVASDASVFDPSRWAVDLAGLAINADMAGILLAGGLRKFGDGDSVEYVGMLMARFAVYGLSVYGGYGSAVVDGERFAAFFAFGAINGPIGGPPAFFLTGIGGGLGINRGLNFPDDLSRFDQFPMIKALDPGARPSDDPMAELALLREYFPMKRGEFWFAAGISFTSFALVDGVAIVAVAIGDGLEIALLGLARLALPRPQFPLVSIELGLIARFSTKEGVFWVQAQLTDNSWLLHESVRLTGGFAFVTWFGGPNKGQFVLTIGGFHPDFHRDGYPKVPRLGFHWGIGDTIVIKGESYFALTSEAVMAGGELKASAEFGPAWAHVRFGANGIVYFDPFRFDVEVYAHISAGVTIDVWIGEITISISLGASIHVMGPKIHGSATFEVGPIELTVEFGEDDQSKDKHIAWDAFVRKYLEEASAGVARVLTAIPGKGALPPGTGPGGATDTGTADGSPEKPFEVFAEFEITVTTMVPTETVRVAGVNDTRTPSHALGIAPMNIAAAQTLIELSLIEAATGADRLGLLVKEIRDPGAFPLGVWGPPQAMEDRKIPKGDIVEAIDSVRFEAKAVPEGTLPGEIAYNRLDPPGPRKPLPFVHARAFRAGFVTAANAVSALLPDALGSQATFAAAKPWLAGGGYGRTALAAIERERSAPPRLGTLTQGLAAEELPRAGIRLPGATHRPPVDTRVLPGRAIAILTAGVLPERPVGRTTVTDRQTPRVPAPTLDAVRAEIPLALAARLVRLPAAGSPGELTLVAAGAVPYTRAARGATAAVSVRGADGQGQDRLGALTLQLTGQRRADRPAADTVRAGEIAVLQLPNAARDLDRKAARPRLVVTGGDARVVALSHGGHVLLDAAGSPGGTLIPRGTERVVVVAIGAPAVAVRGLAGWHGGQELAFIGWSSALAPGSVVQAEGAQVRATRQRFRAGWVHASELIAASAIVNTRFTAAASTVAIVLDEPVGTTAPRDLSLTLEGADRAMGPDGAPRLPTVVSVGQRSVLIYAIVPDIATRRGAVGITVSVARQDGVRLAGVLGGTETPDAMADRIARNGLDAVVQPLVPTTGGTVRLAWVDGTSIPPTGSGVPHQPEAPAGPARPRRTKGTGAGKKKAKRRDARPRRTTRRT
jgi:hypothetical protein